MSIYRITTPRGLHLAGRFAFQDRMEPFRIELDMESFGEVAVSKPKGPRNLRDVIPPGKGRVSADEYLDRVRRGQKLGMKSLLQLLNVEKSGDWQNPSIVCIVGGGPSLQDEVGALRRLVKRGAKVLAVNKSHDWLLKRGLPCHYAVLLDPKEWVADYIDLDLSKSKEIRKRAGKLWADTKYLIASQCHDKTLAKFKDHPRAYMWHAAAGLGESDMLKTEFANEYWVNIAGASVVGLRAVGIAHGLGLREMHFFGIDGSMKPDADGNAKLYAYDKPNIDKTWQTFEVKLKSGWNRAFASNHHMARSVYEFEDSMKQWDRDIQRGSMEPFSVRVHGNPEHSAIAMVAAGMGIHADPTENEKYYNHPPGWKPPPPPMIGKFVSTASFKTPGSLKQYARQTGLV